MATKEIVGSFEPHVIYNKRNMATINLLPQKVFEILLNSGEVIRGRFGTWAMKRFCQRRGNLPLTKIVEVLSAEKNTIDDIVSMILAAVEYSCIKEGKPFNYNDVDVSEWIDELGGLSGDGLTMIFNHAASELPEDKDSEKKSHQNGMKLSDSTAPADTV